MQFEKSKQWWEKSWNPITGCSKISIGCQNCWAEQMATRFRGRAGFPVNDPFKIKLHFSRLNAPLHWKKSRKIFVCSLGDLFHEDVPFEWINRIFKTIIFAKQHSYYILTKRPERMLAYLETRGRKIFKQVYENIWFGVSVENQDTAKDRLKYLEKVDGFPRFVSCEPLLGPIDIEKYLSWLSLVIVGGESGAKARPMNPSWVKKIENVCYANNVEYVFKQWGKWKPFSPKTIELSDYLYPIYPVQKKWQKSKRIWVTGDPKDKENFGGSLQIMTQEKNNIYDNNNKRRQSGNGK